MSKWRRLEIVTVVRALSIVFVVANHSQFGVNLHGGLNALLVITGLSLAQFSFSGTTRHVLHSMIRFGMRVAVPSFILALIWQLGVGRISVPELAFYSNWLYTSRIALFPIWYAQSLVQMLFVIGLIFSVTNMGARITRRPLLWVGLIYLFGVVTAIISLMLWDTSYLADKLPHLLAWNFFFGWLIWAARETLPQTQARILLTCAFFASVVCTFLLVDANNGVTRALIMPFLVLPIIWLDRIQLPQWLARASIVVSQASLFIFFLHYYAFWAIWRLGRAIGLETEAQNPFLRLVVGVVGPTLFWALWTAATRVYCRNYRLLPLYSRMKPKSNITHAFMALLRRLTADRK